MEDFDLTQDQVAKKIGKDRSTIANFLNKKYKLCLYDKAKGAGGRSSFKRYKGKIGFDHGLQYLSPRSKEFKSFTNTLVPPPIPIINLS